MIHGDTVFTNTVAALGAIFVLVFFRLVIKIMYDDWKCYRRTSKNLRVRLAKASAARMVPSTTNTHMVPVYDPETSEYLGSLLLWNHDNSLVEPMMMHE